MNGLIIVPVYNEDKNLEYVIDALNGNFVAENSLYINDGSTDSSSEILKRKRVNYIEHPVNLGYVETLKTGMKYALLFGYEFVVFFDADGQHRVEDLKKIIQFYEAEKIDLISGSRFKDGYPEEVTLRVRVNKLLAGIAGWISKISITDSTSGLKLISSRYLKTAISLSTEDMHAEFIIGMIQTGAGFREVQIKVDERIHGESMYCFAKALFYPVKTILCMFASIFVKIPK